VWVSTNFKLDWPPPNYNELKQKNELLKILDNIENKNLNTIYFQVRSNGTLLFKSSLEPFSPYITGKVGKLGSYDPLEFAIEEAHKRGLEIHAWINTFRVFSGNNFAIKNHPLHISQLHPDWTYKKSDNSIWLNPGLPEVRGYLIELVNEIVQNYNIDGIQLDFIRYPKNQIDDDKSYNQYGNGKPIADWRRENITIFISQLNQRIKVTNPKIKLGVTPIGIYKSIPNGRGMEGYSDVFQDTRKWLSNGIIDYAVPQIYWDAKKAPRFDVLVKDWITNSYGKNIIVGIAAYKPEVYNEIEREINITRNLNTSGVAFFRYKNIRRKQFYSFAEKCLPSEMPWIEATPALAELIISSNFKNRKISLNFNLDKKDISPNGYFALYLKPNLKSSTNNKLLKVVPNYISNISFSLSKPNRINYYYSAIQFDKLWNESSTESNSTKVSIPQLVKIEKEIEPFNNPILLQNEGRSSLMIYSNIDEQMSLFKNFDTTEKRLLSKHFLKKGFNKINLNYDLNKYDEVTISYLNNNRSVTLKMERKK
jgi:uncharacterized lipoprotein YddW (UPF0748 family)